MRIAIATVGVCLSLVLHAAEEKLTIVAIPGQNGWGSSNQEIYRLFGDNQVNIIRVPTPTLAMDFGQYFCQKHLERKIPNGPYIIHATSQGTATALNFLANHPEEKKKVKALILNAVMASGNSAIHHSALGSDQKHDDSSLPYYMLPYVAKLLPGYLTYWPSGQQAIDAAGILSVDKQFADMPIIIGHSKRDPQLPYDDAGALFFRLSLGSEHVYLVSKERPLHVGVLDDEESRCIVQSILHKHGLYKCDNKERIGNLSPYQPEYMQFKKAYDRLVNKEITHKKIGAALKKAGQAGAFTACVYGMYYLKNTLCGCW
jgi:hypothetical protein